MTQISESLRLKGSINVLPRLDRKPRAQQCTRSVCSEVESRWGNEHDISAYSARREKYLFALKAKPCPSYADRMKHVVD